MIYDFIIVGGGPAAALEAETLSAKGHSILLIADRLGGIMHVMGRENLQSYPTELSISNDRIKLEHYISAGALTPTGTEFTAYVSDCIAQANIAKEIGFVSHITKDEGLFCCEIQKKGNLKKQFAKNVVIATGIKANKAPEFMSGTNYMTCLQAYQFFRKGNENQFTGKKIVIVGSGNSAFQIARIAAAFDLEVTILANIYLGLFPQETDDKFALRAQSQLTIERIWKTQTETHLKPLNFHIYSQISRDHDQVQVVLNKKDNEIHIAKASYCNRVSIAEKSDDETKQFSIPIKGTIFVSAIGTVPNIPPNNLGLSIADKTRVIDHQHSGIKGLYLSGSVIGCRSIDTMKASVYDG